MRYCLTIILFFITSIVFSQHLKKKYTGTFQGNMSAYTVILGEDMMRIEQTMIHIQLNPDGTCEEKIGDLSQKGTYQITSEDKSTFTLEVSFKGQVITEKYFVFKKEKQVERKGLYPQPDVFLKKMN